MRARSSHLNWLGNRGMRGTVIAAAFTVFGSAKEPSSSVRKLENLLMRAQQLRVQAVEIQRAIDEALGTAKALIEELRVYHAKGRRHGRRMD